jgi:hypothetical protein
MILTLLKAKTNRLPHEWIECWKCNIKNFTKGVFHYSISLKMKKNIFRNAIHRSMVPSVNKRCKITTLSPIPFLINIKIQTYLNLYQTMLDFYFLILHIFWYLIYNNSIPMNNSVSTVTGKIKIKIVFLGNQSVGKSSIIDKYVNDKFE